MPKFVRWMIVPVVVAVLAACGGQSDADRLDEALTRDLALAASMQYPQQQYMSPMEMGQYPYGQYPQPQQQLYDQYGRPVYAPQPVAQQAIYRAPAPVRTTTTRASTGTVRREPVRNTKRDALIGATAGAVIGSVISRDVKGALIGAAAGGLLGGVVGHTIDVQR